jgi:hypothetical protein
MNSAMITSAVGILRGNLDILRNLGPNFDISRSYNILAAPPRE